MNTDFTASFAKDLRNLRDQRILKHVQRVILAIGMRGRLPISNISKNCDVSVFPVSIAVAVTAIHIVVQCYTS